MDVLDEKLWLKFDFTLCQIQGWGLEIEYFHKRLALVEKPTSR